jgi:hypothetical protein
MEWEAAPGVFRKSIPRKPFTHGFCDVGNPNSGSRFHLFLKGLFSFSLAWKEGKDLLF